MVRECEKYTTIIDATPMTNHEFNEYKNPVASETADEEEGYLVIHEDDEKWVSKEQFGKKYLKACDIDNSKSIAQSLNADLYNVILKYRETELSVSELIGTLELVKTSIVATDVQYVDVEF